MKKQIGREEWGVKPSTDTEGNGMHAVIFLFKGTESFQFAAVRLLHVDVGNSVAYYQLHLLTNYLLNSITKDTMDSHIHSVLARSLM